MKPHQFGEPLVYLFKVERLKQYKQRVQRTGLNTIPTPPHLLSAKWRGDCNEVSPNERQLRGMNEKP